jgi:hypothetical protein
VIAARSWGGAVLVLRLQGFSFVFRPFRAGWRWLNSPRKATVPRYGTSRSYTDTDLGADLSGMRRYATEPRFGLERG